MAIGSGIPGKYNFRCRVSPLNHFVTKPFIGLKPENVNTNATAKSTTRLHLANLEKLLQKPTSLDPQPHQIEPNDMSFEKKGIGILEGFQLTGIWPDWTTVSPDDVSPQGLNSLQHLLSKTPEYSPRNHLGSQWRKYHGSNDWEGLLDPLDENLRRELVRCGEFVQSAYHAFNANPTTSANESPLPPHVTLPDKSYKVTKSLYATSSINLPKLIDDVAPNLDWMTQRSSWIGYIAICDDQKEIQRMGRRDIVIALRGTATCLEWAENLRAQLVPIPNDERESNQRLGQPKVECGFLSLFKTSNAHVPSLAESVTEEVKRLIEKHKGETLSITVTGHSLGAALAVLVADKLSTCAPNVPPLAVFSFGGPRVGNKAFADTINAKNVKVLRIVNNQDVITKVPGMFLNEGLEQKLRGIKIEGLLEDNMPWDYSHVGSELRVDTKMSPYLKPNADVACCHDLEAYLHLVDGFSSSNCPFRANAKRSLLKLLHEQGSNVKKLYTSKAKSLNLNIETKGLPVMSTCLPSPS